MSTLSGPPVGSTPDAHGSEQTFVGGKRQSQNTPSAKIESAAKSIPAATTSRISGSADAAGSKLLGSRYEEKEEIGRGGCGVVLRAFDRLMQRDVVIKRVLGNSGNTKETVSRFLNEARITGRLEHPGIVPVHEIGQGDSDGIPYYVMKWLHGVTLKEAINDYHATKIASEKQRKFHELLNRFRQVCQTLAYAHEHDVIHRDLKPANIMVGSFGETIVLDWGLAKDLGKHSRELQPESVDEPTNEQTLGISLHQSDEKCDSKRNTRSQGASNNHDGLTQIGAVMGTAAYMSPEQARGESDRVDSRSDVFSLGVILYEILAGVSPFRSNSVQTTLKLVAIADFKRPRKLNRHVPLALDAICNRAMNLAPEDRYQDAKLLADDIENYLSGNAVTAYREPWWGKVDRVAGNHRTLVRSAFVALFAIAMLSILGAAKIDFARRAETTARLHAENETREKEVAHQRERVAHSRSLTQLQAARKSVDAWLIDLSGDLQFYPGLAPLRRELLEKAQQYYQTNLESTNDSTPETLESARCSLRLGDIARLSGQIVEARSRYTAAEVLLLRLQSDDERPEPTISTQYANALLGLSLCSLDANDGHEVEQQDGIPLAEKAAEAAKHALTLSPDDRDARKTWLRTQQCLARLNAKNPQPAGGTVLLEKPIAMAELLLKENDDPSTFYLLTSLVSDQSQMLESDGQTEAAIEGYQRLIQIYSQQLRKSPQRPDWLEQRANAHSRLGICNTQVLRTQLAVSEYESAESDMQNAWLMRYEDTYFLESFAATSANLGKALFMNGDLQQAETSLRTAIARLQEVIQHDGSTPDRIQRMANLFLSLATAIEPQSPDEYRKLVQDSRKLLNHLSKEKTPSVQCLALDAQCSLLEAKNELSREAWQEAIGLCDEAIHRIPSSFESASVNDSEVSLMHGKLLDLRSHCQWKMNLVDDAKASWSEAQAIFDECQNSKHLETSVASMISSIESRCESELASPDDHRRSLAQSQRLISVAAKHAASWHWRAVAAWRYNRPELARDALKQAKRLRARPALEDELLEALLTLPESKKEASIVARIESLASKEAVQSRHIAFLLREILKTQD